MADHYDVIVAGAGIGGLCAALRARENGASVAILEKPTKVSMPVSPASPIETTLGDRPKARQPALPTSYSSEPRAMPNAGQKPAKNELVGTNGAGACPYD